MNETTEAIQAVKNEIEEIFAALNRKTNGMSHIASALFLSLCIFCGIMYHKVTIFYAMFGVIFIFIAVYIIASNTKKPLRQSLEILDKPPVTADDFMLRGHVFLEFYHAQAASIDFAQAMKLDPDEPANTFLYASSLNLLNRSDEALQILESLLMKENPNKAAAYFLKGSILKKDDPTIALECVEKAIELEPDDLNYRLEKVRLLLEAGKYAEAEKAFTELTPLVQNEMKRGNEPPEFHELGGRISVKQNRYSEALASFNRAVKLDPFIPEYYEHRAEVYEKLAQPSKAESDRAKAEKLYAEVQQ